MKVTSQWQWLNGSQAAEEEPIGQKGFSVPLVRRKRKNGKIHPWPFYDPQTMYAPNFYAMFPFTNRQNYDTPFNLTWFSQNMRFFKKEYAFNTTKEKKKGKNMYMIRLGYSINKTFDQRNLFLPYLIHVWYSRNSESIWWGYDNDIGNSIISILTR